MKGDVLLETFADLLVRIGKTYHWHLAASSLLQLSPQTESSEKHFLKMAEVAGFDAKYTAYKADEISAPLLPAIVFFENVPVLLQAYDQAQKKYLLVENKKEHWVDQEKFSKCYSEKMLLLKPNFSSPQKNDFIEGRGHWLWNSLKFSSSIYMDVFLATFLLNLFALLTPLFVRNVYDRVIPNAAFDTLFVLSSGIVLVYVFDVLFRFLRTYLLELAGKKSDIIISSRLFEQVLNMQLSHKFKSVGAFVSNIKEFDTLRNFLSSATLTMVIDLPFVFLFLFTIYIFAGNIVLVPLLAGVVIILYGLAIARPLKKHIDKNSELGAWKNGMLIESLSALETVKSLNLNKVMQWRWEESVGEMATISMRSKILTTSMSTLTSFIVQISNVLVIIMGVYAIHDGKFSMGGLIAVTMLSSRALSPLAQISSLIINYEYAKSSFVLLDNIFNSPAERDTHKQYIYRDEIKGKVEFRDVTFCYQGAEHPVLEDLNFTINPGEHVGILGENGSGKSTLLKLIMGFYVPTKGSILIDDIDTRQIDPVELRQRLNYLSQDITLFQGTLQDNILYANPNAQTDKMMEASIKSGLSRLLESDPHGYGLNVGERGENLSGGQRQLVGLTRFFIKDKSRILLLDEPSNGLDSSAEIHATDMLQTFIENKTTLLVTHKKSMLKMVSRIIIIKGRNIVFDGSSDEAMKRLQRGAR